MLAANAAKDICRSKKHIITALIIMVLLLLSSGCTESKKTTGTKAPVKFSDTIFFKYGDVGLKNASEQGLINAVNLTTKNGSDSMVVKEVFYDRTRVCVSLVAGSGGLIAKEFDYKFYYNGKLFPTPVNWNRFLKVIQGRQYDIVSLDTFSGLPVKFDLKIVATRFGNSKEVLSTTVPVDRAQSDVLTKEASVMRGFIAKPRSVTIKSILIAPSATIVRYEYSGLSNDTLNSPQLVDQ
ncbi:MAG: hypothetical protein HY779_04895, partial [Rubrobacteridae bacterium]|nr:hypothetical protein [Rubrobacteridae bacterium]